MTADKISLCTLSVVRPGRGEWLSAMQLSFVLSRVDSNKALISVCDIPRLGSSMGTQESMLITLGTVLKAGTTQNNDVPHGMVSYDCHGTQLLADDCFLGLVGAEILTDVPFFSAMCDYSWELMLNHASILIGRSTEVVGSPPRSDWR